MGHVIFPSPFPHFDLWRMEGSFRSCISQNKSGLLLLQLDFISLPASPKIPIMGCRKALGFSLFLLCFGFSTCSCGSREDPKRKYPLSSLSFMRHPLTFCVNLLKNWISFKEHGKVFYFCLSFSFSERDSCHLVRLAPKSQPPTLPWSPDCKCTA